MRSPANEYVTLVEVLERKASFEKFSSVIESTVRRLETEGVKALVTINFYASPDTTEVGAVITFNNRNALMEHINTITQWEEFKQLLHVVKPIDVKVYGKLNPEAEQWLRTMNVVSKKFENHVAGFSR